MSYLYNQVTEDKYTSYLDFLYNFKGNPKDLKLHYWDDIFSKYDWTKEPEEDYEHLLATRAQQLRDSYNYLRLYCSGGADSTTMLQVFVDNNIFVDEVVIFRLSLIDNFDDNFIGHREMSFAGRPFLKKMSLQMPNMKITWKDIGAKEIKAYFDREDWLFFSQNSTWDLSLLGLIMINLDEICPEFKIEGKTVGNIAGHVKPCLKKVAGRYKALHSSSEYFRFCHSSIPFYVTPDLPELHIKQCHLVKNHFKRYYPDYPDGELINDMNTGWVRDAVEKACRYSYDNRFLTDKCPLIASPGKNIAHLYEGYTHNKLLYGQFKEVIKYFTSSYSSAFRGTLDGKLHLAHIMQDLGE